MSPSRRTRTSLSTNNGTRAPKITHKPDRRRKPLTHYIPHRNNLHSRKHAFATDRRLHPHEGNRQRRTYVDRRRHYRLPVLLALNRTVNNGRHKQQSRHSQRSTDASIAYLRTPTHYYPRRPDVNSGKKDINLTHKQHSSSKEKGHDTFLIEN